MRRVQVQSSSLAKVGYDPQRNLLEVAFRKGDIYQYFNVPESVYRELMQAASIGTFINTRIKKVYRLDNGVGPE